MKSITDSVRAHGGLIATHELHADGHFRGSIANALAHNRLVRVRQGWYCPAELHPLLREAARVGGAATCVSALALHGAWTVKTDILHVSVLSNSCRLRTRADKRARLADSPGALVRVHWSLTVPDHRLLLDPIECLRDLLHCETPEMSTAVADSVLHRNPDLTAEWLALVETQPLAARIWLSRIDGVCESGTESIFWFRMSPLGLPLRRQVRIARVGRVDFLIGSKLIVEVDSAKYHTDPDAYERDRRRDAQLSALGYRVLRFTYEQILNRWPEVEAAVLASILRGDHR